MADEIRAVIFNLDGVILEAKTLKPAHDQAEAQIAATAAGMVYGAMEFMDVARDKFSLAGVTMMTRILQHLVFDKFNLHYYFEAVITGDELKKANAGGGQAGAEANPYVLALQYLKDFPDQCVAVVDTIEHVYLARKAGCKVVAISTATPADKLTEAGAEEVVPDFDQLKKALGLEGTFLKT